MRAREGRLWGFLGLAILSLSIVGCGQAPLLPAPGLGFKPPEIRNVSVEPTVLGVLGGEVTVRAEVEDLDGDLKVVTAEFTATDGGKASIDLNPSGEGLIYQGTWRVPGNSREDGQPVVYTVTVRAEDERGLKAEADGGDITVQAAQIPPEEPAF